MPIDPNIALSVKPPQFESPLNQLAQVLQIQGLQRQNEMGGIQLDQTRRGMEEQNALRRLLGEQGFDITNPEMQRRALAVSPAGAQSLIKANMENQRAGVEISGKRTETAIKKASLYRDALAGVSNPQQAAQWLQSQYQDADLKGIFPVPFEQAAANIPQDPEGFQQWVQKQAMGMGKFIERSTPDVDNVVAMRGQDMTDARARDLAAAQRDQAAATKEAAKTSANTNIEMKLADDYRNQSKNFKEVSDAYSQISKTLDKASTSPAATLAAATKFMKLLDPGSVVRESELGMALAASGVIDRAFNYYEIIQRGKVLTPQQVQDFKNITAQIFQAAQDQQKSLDADYTAKANQYGVRPDMVIQQLGQTKSPKNSNQTARVSSDAEYNALPSGAVFIGPDGKTRRKP